MKDKKSVEEEKKNVKDLTALDPKVWALEYDEYDSKLDLKGKYKVSESTLVVELPLKVINTKKWCDFMWKKIEGD